MKKKYHCWKTCRSLWTWKLFAIRNYWGKISISFSKSTLFQTSTYDQRIFFSSFNLKFRPAVAWWIQAGNRLYFQARYFKLGTISSWTTKWMSKIKCRWVGGHVKEELLKKKFWLRFKSFLFLKRPFIPSNLIKSIDPQNSGSIENKMFRLIISLSWSSRAHACEHKKSVSLSNLEFA